MLNEAGSYGVALTHMNRFVAGSLLVLVIIAALAAGIYYYQRYSIILENPLKAVPADAAFIVEAKRPAESLKKLFSGELKKEFEEKNDIKPGTVKVTSKRG